MEEWKEYKLGEICNTISDTYSDKALEVVLINTSDVLDGKCLNHTFVPNKDLRGQFKKAFKKNDILYSEIRPANRRYAFIDFEPQNYIASTKLMVIRANGKVLPKYLYYILQGKEMVECLQLLAETRSGTFPQITFSELAKQKVKLPPLSWQNSIVSFLEVLDAKIELNRRINDNLEQQAQALFRSWFVDFEPFGGVMPKDWEIVKMNTIISDIAAGPFGSNLPKSCFTNSGVPIIDGANLKGRIVDETFTKFVSQQKAHELKRSIVHKDEIIVTISGTVGQISYIAGTSKYDEYLVSQRQFRVALDKQKSNLYYIICYFSNDLGKNQILSFANQVGVPALAQPLKNFRNIDIMLPTKIIQDRFGEIINKIDERICKNEEENKRLTSLRDILLPKLISGELKVNEINA